MNFAELSPKPASESNLLCTLCVDPDLNSEDDSWMVLFSGTSRQDINHLTGWRGSALDRGPDFTISGLCLTLGFALCKG